MNPVFYIGTGSGEIHLKMSKACHINIKIDTDKFKPRYAPLWRYTGIAQRVLVNGIEQPEFVGRRVSYFLLAELYKISTGEDLKYRSIASARTNLEAVQKLIEELAPDLHIDFKPIEKVKPEVEYSVEDQIFNFWMKNNV